MKSLSIIDPVLRLQNVRLDKMLHYLLKLSLELLKPSCTQTLNWPNTLTQKTQVLT